MENDIFDSSSVPSGASTGSNEAIELRDNDKKRYHGMGVKKAIENVNNIIAPKLINKTLNESIFEKIDKMMIELDGTKINLILVPMQFYQFLKHCLKLILKP